MPLFRTTKAEGPKPDSPALLFRDLPKDSSVKFLWGHQEKLLDEYHRSLMGTKNVAVELPTGSGKTLVGMLIGEYRRRALGERVAFLCPNKQLCCQVEAQAHKYGIATSLLIGPQKDYDVVAFSRYQQGSVIAITTYSGLFNSNPKIADPQTIICDDAHAADGFVASMWTFRVDRDKHEEFFLKLYFALKPAMPRWLDHAIESYDRNPRDRSGVDLATPILALDCFDDVRAVVKDGMPDVDRLKYPWGQISEHLDACLIFASSTVIEIRPIIPPTKVHVPFAGANQRVYMSATLGEDGSLERFFGVGKIRRLPIPEGWDKRGTGRRLMLFPMLAAQEEPVDVFQAVVSEASRILVLVPSEFARTQVAQYLPDGFSVLGPEHVEKDMTAFTNARKVILLLANRYDGIDLPGADCRMLVVYGRPTGATLLERYFMDRLGATSVLRDRLRTRVTQAVGRCTRDEGDFSVVVLMGEDLVDWCSTTANMAGIHPELQAEITFGLENSENRPKGELVQLARALLTHTDDWPEAEQDIQLRRDKARKVKDSVTDVLAQSAPLEIDYCLDCWAGRHEQAYHRAVEVTETLQGGSDLLPYRSFWYHQAAVSAYLAYTQTGQDSFRQTAADLLGRASSTSLSCRWLPDVQARLAGQPVPRSVALPIQEWFLSLRGLLSYLGRVGKRCVPMLADHRTYIKATESKRFEKGLETLGRLLGAEAKDFIGQDGAPDGFWLFGDWLAFVFEAKTDERDDYGISFDTVRQAGAHEKTVRSMNLLPDYVPCKTVVISPRTGLDRKAIPHAGELCYISSDDVVALFDRASQTFREVRAGSSGNTDEVLRERFLSHYAERHLSMSEVADLLQKTKLTDLPVR